MLVGSLETNQCQGAKYNLSSCALCLVVAYLIGITTNVTRRKDNC